MEDGCNKSTTTYEPEQNPTLPEQNRTLDYYNEKGELDVSRLVLLTALKSIYRFFIISVLIFVLILGMFPLASMRFFESIGLNERALYMVDIYIRREQKNGTGAFSAYADGLYYKMMLSEELYFNSKPQNADKFLDDIYSSTYAYSKIRDIDERNAHIDSGNLQYIAPIAHANIFSFKDRVSNLNYFAALRLGKGNEFLIGDRLLKIEDIILELSYVESSDLSADIVYGVIPEIALDFSIIFGQISEYTRFTLENTGAQDPLESPHISEPTLKQLMNVLEQKLSVFEDFYLNYRGNFNDYSQISEVYVRQTQLYMLRCLGRLYDQILAAAVRLDYRWEQWQALSLVNIDSTALTVSEYYYSVLLPEYLEFYSTITGD